MKDLGSRLAVAVVGIPAILGLLYLGGWALGVPLALLAMLGAGEVYALAEARGVRPLSWVGMPAAAAPTLLAVVRPDFLGWAPWVVAAYSVTLAVTLVTALWTRGPVGGPLASTSVTMFGVAYAGLPLAFVPLLHDLPRQLDWGGPTPSPWLGGAVVLLPLAATWVGDAAAYFAGTWWGKRKLFPAISPAKSWVGAWAGILGSAGAALAWVSLSRLVLPEAPVVGVVAVLGAGGLLGVGAIFGDLVESLLKREAGVKDSGTFFRGHGGVLDRLDALAFTLPMGYGVLWIAGTVVG